MPGDGGRVETLSSQREQQQRKILAICLGGGMMLLSVDMESTL
jgi:hypothetical protein